MINVLHYFIKIVFGISIIIPLVSYGLELEQFTSEQQNIIKLYCEKTDNLHCASDCSKSYSIQACENLCTICSKYYIPSSLHGKDIDISIKQDTSQEILTIENETKISTEVGVITIPDQTIITVESNYSSIIPKEYMKPSDANSIQRAKMDQFMSIEGKTLLFAYNIGGVDGLVFNKPVKVELPVPTGYLGNSIEMFIAHGLETPNTKGLTTNPNASCNPDGSTSDANNIFSIINGSAVGYTCRASVLGGGTGGGGTGSNMYCMYDIGMTCTPCQTNSDCPPIINGGPPICTTSAMITLGGTCNGNRNGTTYNCAPGLVCSSNAGIGICEEDTFPETSQCISCQPGATCKFNSDCGTGGSCVNEICECTNCDPNEGRLCTSNPNACGQTATGTVLCSGDCSEPTPPLPPQPPVVNCWDNFVFNTGSCMRDNTGTQPTQPTTACYETATFNTGTCVWDVTGTQPTQPTTACYETATFNTGTCVWDVTGTQPTQPTTACYETATFNTGTCVWDVTGTQPTQPTTACYETATFNTGTCVWDVTGTQPTQPTTACYETATFNTGTCVWDVTGTQPTQPTTACYETATFNTGTCVWDVTGTQPTQPTTACYETATFNTGTCVWDVTGTQPTQPTTACYETATFNTGTCVWDVTGTQPTQPTTACYETATFNTGTCVWDVTGTQPTQPTTACYETATFNTGTCVWDVTGTQPTQPTTACYETATFNTGTCVWDVTGTQPTQPTTACYETATFNTGTCVWDVTGTQPTQPTTACYETATFNTGTCVWDVTGTQPTQPTTACYETATFNTGTCVWDVTGTQPTQPTTACYETATFNTGTCVWDVTGTQPTQPTTACYETATFNTGTCVWDVTGTQPTAPTTACYETATFNTGTCVWDVTGTQPTQPTTACYETATFNTGTCVWDVTGTQPTQPTTACYETATFNTGTCVWDVTGTQPTAPTTACYETATFNTGTCVWDVTGTQPTQPTTACYETATFNTGTCVWDVTGTQPTAPTTACYETATFNTGTCVWDVTGNAPAPITITTDPEPAELNCSNRSVVLSVSGEANGSIYTWNDGSTTETITVTSSGTYEVTVTNSNNTCEQTAEINIQDICDIQVDKRILSASEYTGSGGSSYPTEISEIEGSSDAIGALNPGDRYVYHIKVTNKGNGTATGISVQDDLPVGVAVFLIEENGFDTIEENNGVISGFIATLAENTSATADVYVKFTKDASIIADNYSGVNLCNTAEIIPQYDTDTVNNTENSCIPVNTCSTDQACAGEVYMIDIDNTLNTATCIVESTCGYSDQFDATYTYTGGKEWLTCSKPTCYGGMTMTYEKIAGSYTMTADGSQVLDNTANPLGPVNDHENSGTCNTCSECLDPTSNAPDTSCRQTATWNIGTCVWDVTGTQPAQPTTACYETATFNTGTCVWDVTGTQPAEPTTPLACYETRSFNTTSCTWETSGTQPAEPTTPLACYETRSFNTTSCTWETSGTQPAEPTTPLACYETRSFNTTTCLYDITGDAPTPLTITTNPEPAELNCSNRAVVLSVSGATNGSIYTWNDGSTTETITVTSSGTYEVRVTNSNNTCEQTAEITIQDICDIQVDKRILSASEYTGSGGSSYPSEISEIEGSSDASGALNPGDRYVYHIKVTNKGNGTATGISVQDDLPVGVSVFLIEENGFDTIEENNGVISGFIATLAQNTSATADVYVKFTKDASIIADNYNGIKLCNTAEIIPQYDTDTVNNTENSCIPVNTCSTDQACAGEVYMIDISNTLNTATCIVESTCGYSDEFAATYTNTGGKEWLTCSVSTCYGGMTMTYEKIAGSYTMTANGLQILDNAANPLGPVNDHENSGTCNTCSECLDPTSNAPDTSCRQTATWNIGTCVWDVTGTQPTQPTTACYETATFNTGTCVWDVTGTQPTAPTTACYETATFNTGTCVWDVTGTQPTQPTTACYETATFNTGTCVWDVTGTQAPAPTGLECWQTTTFNTGTCLYDITGDAPTPLTITTNPEPAELNCSNRAVVLSVSGATNGSIYTWNDGSTTETITVTSSGTYEVRVTNSNNTCEQTAEITIQDICDIQVDKRILSASEYTGSGGSSYPSEISEIEGSSDASGALNPGDRYVYHIKVTNKGNGTATGISVQDDLPVGVSVFLIEENGFDTIEENNGVISGFIATLAQNTSATADVYVKFTKDASIIADNYNGIKLCNTAEIIPQYDTDTVNNTENSCIPVNTCSTDQACAGEVYMIDISNTLNTATCIVESTCGYSDEFAATYTNTGGKEWLTCSVSTCYGGMTMTYEKIAGSYTMTADGLQILDNTGNPLGPVNDHENSGTCNTCSECSDNDVCNLDCSVGTDPDCKVACSANGCVSSLVGYDDLVMCTAQCSATGCIAPLVLNPSTGMCEQDCSDNDVCNLDCPVGTDPDCKVACSTNGCVSSLVGYDDLVMCTAQCSATGCIAPLVLNPSTGMCEQDCSDNNVCNLDCPVGTDPDCKVACSTNGCVSSLVGYDDLVMCTAQCSATGCIAPLVLNPSTGMCEQDCSDNNVCNLDCPVGTDPDCKVACSANGCVSSLVGYNDLAMCTAQCSATGCIAPLVLNPSTGMCEQDCSDNDVCNLDCPVGTDPDCKVACSTNGCVSSLVGYDDLVMCTAQCSATGCIAPLVLNPSTGMCEQDCSDNNVCNLDCPVGTDPDCKVACSANGCVSSLVGYNDLAMCTAQCSATGCIAPLVLNPSTGMCEQDCSDNDVCNLDCPVGTDPDCKVACSANGCVSSLVGYDDLVMCTAQCSATGCIAPLVLNPSTGMCEQDCSDNDVCNLDCPVGTDPDCLDCDADSVCNANCPAGTDPDCPVCDPAAPAQIYSQRANNRNRGLRADQYSGPRCLVGSPSSVSYLGGQSDPSGYGEWSWSCSAGDQTITCQIPNAYCGDGTVDPGESCDDGNDIRNDSCSNQCSDLGTNVCGDGTIQLPNDYNVREQCEIDANDLRPTGCIPGECVYDSGSCGAAHATTMSPARQPITGWTPADRSMLCAGGLIERYGYDTTSQRWTWNCLGRDATDDTQCRASHTDDPDCAADTICNASCPAGTDPDCPDCAADTICNASCPAGTDPDCPDCAADTICNASCPAGTDPDCTSPSTGICTALDTQVMSGSIYYNCSDDDNGSSYAVTMRNSLGAVIASSNDAAGMFVAPNPGNYTVTCSVDGHVGSLICDSVQSYVGSTTIQIIGNTIVKLKNKYGYTTINRRNLARPGYPYAINTQNYENLSLSAFAQELAQDLVVYMLHNSLPSSCGTSDCTTTGPSVAQLTTTVATIITECYQVAAQTCNTPCIRTVTVSTGSDSSDDTPISDADPIGGSPTPTDPDTPPSTPSTPTAPVCQGPLCFGPPIQGTPSCSYAQTMTINAGEYLPIMLGSSRDPGQVDFGLTDPLTQCANKPIGTIAANSLRCDIALYNGSDAASNQTQAIRSASVPCITTYGRYDITNQTQISSPTLFQSYLQTLSVDPISTSFAQIDPSLLDTLGSYQLRLNQISRSECAGVDTSGLSIVQSRSVADVCASNFVVTAPYVMQEGFTMTTSTIDNTLSRFVDLDGSQFVADPVVTTPYTSIDATIMIDNISSILSLASSSVGNIPGTNITIPSGLQRIDTNPQVYVYNGDLTLTSVLIAPSADPFTLIVTDGDLTIEGARGDADSAASLIVTTDGKTIFRNLNCETNLVANNQGYRDHIYAILVSREGFAQSNMVKNHNLNDPRCYGGTLEIRGMLISPELDTISSLAQSRRSTIDPISRYQTTDKRPLLLQGAALRIINNPRIWSNMPPLLQQAFEATQIEISK